MGTACLRRRSDIRVERHKAGQAQTKLLQPARANLSNNGFSQCKDNISTRSRDPPVSLPWSLHAVDPPLQPAESLPCTRSCTLFFLWLYMIVYNAPAIRSGPGPFIAARVLTGKGSHAVSLPSCSRGARFNGCRSSRSRVRSRKHRATFSRAAQPRSLRDLPGVSRHRLPADLERHHSVWRL